MKTILIVDDDVDLLAALGRLLKMHGYGILTADNVKLGIALAKERKPDLVILDIQMPGVSGLGLLKEITGPDGKRDTRVMVLTGRAHMDGFFKNLDIDGFLEKTCSKEAMLAMIGKITGDAGPDGVTGELVGDGRRVIVVNEDRASAEKIASALVRAGVSAEIVLSSSDVVERVLASMPSCLAIDRIMHDLNGDKLAGILGEIPKTRRIPVVVYEADGDPERGKKLKAANRNIVAYVPDDKPEAIVEMILTHIERGRR